MLQVWVSGNVPSSARQVGLWFLFSKKATFASSELVYMRGANGLFLSQVGVQLISIVQFIDSYSQGLIWCSVMWGVYIPLTSVSMRGWLLSTVQGRGDLNGKEMWEGVEGKGKVGTDFFFPRWLCMSVPQD